MLREEVAGPPLDVGALRREWAAIREQAARIPPRGLGVSNRVSLAGAGTGGEAVAGSEADRDYGAPDRIRGFGIDGVVGGAGAAGHAAKGDVVFPMRGRCGAENGGVDGGRAAGSLPRIARGDPPGGVLRLLAQGVPAVSRRRGEAVFARARFSHGEASEALRSPNRTSPSKRREGYRSSGAIRPLPADRIHHL